MRWRWVPLVLVLCLASGGCGGGESNAGPAPTLAPVSTTDPKFSGTPAGGDVIGGPTIDVVLVDPGAEPRRELRLDPPVGTVQAQTLLVDQGITLELDGQAQSVPSTGLELDVTYTVEAVDEDSITYRARYDDLRPAGDLDPALAASVEQMRADFVGTEGVIVIDRRGGILSSSLGVPGADQATQEIVDDVTSLSTPLPAEPVGVGASWETRSSTSASGMLFNVSSRFEVVELTDEQVVMAIEVHMNMPSGIQTILGQSVQVGGGDIDGEGRTAWRFDQPVGVVEQSSSGSLSMSMSRGDQTADLTLTLRQRMEQRPR